MAGKYRYGYKSLKLSDIDPATGLAAAGTAKELKEDVYRDTFDIVEEEGTTTDHFSEMDADPKISFTEGGKTNVRLQVMDTSVETLALLKGGEVVTNGETGDKTYSKPSTAQQIVKYVELETQDGYKIVIPRGKVVARLNHQVRRNGIALLDVTITPMTPEVAGLSAMDTIEPGAPAPAV